MVTIYTPSMTPTPPMSCWAVGTVLNNKKVHSTATTELSVNTIEKTLILTCRRIKGVVGSKTTCENLIDT